MKYYRIICNKANDNKENGNFDIYKIEIPSTEVNRFFDELNRLKFINVNGALVNTDDIRRVIEFGNKRDGEIR